MDGKMNSVYHEHETPNRRGICSRADPWRSADGARSADAPRPELPARVRLFTVS